MQKLLQLINDVEQLEDFVKIEFHNFKISEQTANEILRIISEAKTRALK